MIAARSLVVVMLGYGFFGCGDDEGLPIQGSDESTGDSEADDGRRSPESTLLDFSSQVEIDGRVHDLPILELEVGASTAAFYVWKDLSAAFLLSADSAGTSVPEEELEGLSVAEVFWALSRPGEQIPQALMLHHAARFDSGDGPSWSEAIAGREQGWARDRPTPRSLPECNNTTFNSAHCSLTSGYVGKTCSFDSTASASLDHYGPGALGTLKYHAAICIDGGGSAVDSLWWTNSCGLDPIGVIWFSAVFGSPGYGSFTWIAPSTLLTARRWLHSGSPSASPGARDWASKWGQAVDCSGSPI